MEKQRYFVIEGMGGGGVISMNIYGVDLKTTAPVQQTPELLVLIMKRALFFFFSFFFMDYCADRPREGYMYISSNKYLFLVIFFVILTIVRFLSSPTQSTTPMQWDYVQANVRPGPFKGWEVWSFWAIISLGRFFIHYPMSLSLIYPILCCLYL